MRLNATRSFHPPLEGIGFQYGFNTKYLQTVLDFWKTKYVWAERQTLLNSLPQYTTSVAGLKIHFIHMKPPRANGVSISSLSLICLSMYFFVTSIKEIQLYSLVV